MKVRIDVCTQAAKISEGKIFRPVNKEHRGAGEFIADEEAIWQVSSITPTGSKRAKLQE